MSKYGRRAAVGLVLLPAVVGWSTFVPAFPYHGVSSRVAAVARAPARTLSVSGGVLAFLAVAAADNRANQKNPNNPAYHSSRSSTPTAVSRAQIRSKPSPRPAHNHANQLNPNNPAYHASRGSSLALHKSKADFQRGVEAQKRESKSSNKAVKDVVPRVEKIVRDVCGSDSHLVLRGSTAKKIAVKGSDRDYMVQTRSDVTRGQRNSIVEKCKQDSVLQGRYTEIRAKTNAISFKGTKHNPDLDIVPQDVAYTQKADGFKRFEAHKKAHLHNHPVFKQQSVQNAVVAARKSGFTDCARAFQVAEAVKQVATKYPTLLHDQSGQELYAAFVRGGPSSFSSEYPDSGPLSKRQRVALQQQFHVARKAL